VAQCLSPEGSLGNFQQDGEMKRTGKWIDGTTPEQPVTSAAREAVKLRLQLVAHYLPLAAASAEEDREYVHQLRVATRRATAALKIFSELLPNKQLSWMKKRLRRIRQAAGDARDLDVLIARLEQRIDKAAGDTLPELVEELSQRRVSAQPPIVEIDAHTDAGSPCTCP
jgi:CHAD domain-containing protein